MYDFNIGKKDKKITKTKCQVTQDKVKTSVFQTSNSHSRRIKNNSNKSNSFSDWRNGR